MTEAPARRHRPGRRGIGIGIGVGAAVLVLVAAVGVVVLNDDDGGPSSDVVWSDEFDGAKGTAPNPKIWQYAVGGDGWGNGELECHTTSRSNSALDGNGDLVITARYDPGHRCSGGTVNDYTSARLKTEKLRTMGYGRLRVRAKMPTASGAWPAIWALGENHDTAGWPTSGEIDVSEVVGSQPTTVHQTIHGPDANVQPFSITHKTEVPSVASYAWHVYGIDRTKDSITFSVDERKTYEITRAQVQAKGSWVFEQPFYLLLNVAVGGQFPGPPQRPQDYPQRMIVDYVRVLR